MLVDVTGGLQIAITYGTWEWDDVTDVTHSCEVHYATLKAESEACMARATVFTKIKVELVVLFLEAAFLHSLKKYIVVVLTL